MQSGAGTASGFSDQQYRDLGVGILPDAAAVYDQGELIVKVKEPVDAELDLLQPRHLLFSFLHLAALPGLTQNLCEIGLTAVAFETVMDNHSLPILNPMSQIAGRIAVQTGTHYQHRPQGGKGLMLGGIAGTGRGHVVVIGAGHAGGEAAILAAQMGAEVTVFDRQTPVLEKMRAHAPNITALHPYTDSITAAVSGADLLIGAVLVPGARAPHVVSRQQVCNMQAGSVIVDIAVDQGGCIETSRPTRWDDPMYSVGDVNHVCVTNLPGAVPRTASMALSGSLLPYVLRLAAGGLKNDSVLAGAINVARGQVVHPALQGE